MTSSDGVPKIMVFRPTMDEFKDFHRYIEHIEHLGAHKAGIAKIVSPKEWFPRKSGYDNIDLIIPAPLLQTVTGTQGHYQQINSQTGALHVKEFEKMAFSTK